MPNMYIISGCNGSGKTTASYSLLPAMLGCSEFVNSDEFAKSLAPFKPESAYVAASRLMLLKMIRLLEQKSDFCIETTLATRFLLKMVRNAQANGYYVTIKEETIRRRYHVGLHYFFRDFMPVCNRWILCDNSTEPLRIVAESSEDGLIVRDPETFSKIKSTNSLYEKELREEEKRKRNV